MYIYDIVHAYTTHVYLDVLNMLTALTRCPRFCRLQQQNGALVLGLTETGIQTNQKLGPEVKALLKQSTRLDSSKAFDGVLVGCA